MSLRKLVTIRKIVEITPIEGADLIELVRVDGWRSVVKKNQFKVGDYAVYFEIDSFLPIEPRYEFLRQKYSKKMIVEGKGEVEGIRLRTVTFKGKISQGLILPLSDFPEFDLSTDIGIDLSEKIGVLKYEQPIPACIAGKIRRAIPSCIKKTDQLRIQNALDFFEIFKDVEFEETEKMSKKKQVEKELDKIKAFHAKVLKEAENIIVSDEKKSCFTYICNTSGGTVLLPDFRALDVDPSSTKVFSMKAGQIINLLTMFEPIVINRNRSALLTAFNMKGMHGLAMLTCVKGKDVKFPIELNPGRLIIGQKKKEWKELM